MDLDPLDSPPLSRRERTLRALAVLAATLTLLSIGATCAAFSPRKTFDPVGGVTTWSADAYRLRDIADTPYSQDFCESFSYEQSRVVLEYDAVGETFRAVLRASGLKPNFAYQVKLTGYADGDPATPWDEVSNERLGFTGRWWRVRPDPDNTWDADVEAHRNDPDYAFQGYLLFDWFVTDGRGDAAVTLELDDSLHVLWKRSQYPPDDDDTALRDHVVDPVSDAYDAPPAPTVVSLYGERETGRALPGSARLPEGRYRCRLLLTEESFHQSYIDGGGMWAAALLSDPLDFEIRSPAVRFELRRNAVRVSEGETLRLSLAAEMSPDAPSSGPVDVYLAVTGPDDKTVFLHDGDVLPRAMAKPWVSGWIPEDVPEVVFVETVVDGLAEGRYTVQATLLRPGGDLDEPLDMVDHAVVGFDVVDPWFYYDD